LKVDQLGKNKYKFAWAETLFTLVVVGPYKNCAMLQFTEVAPGEREEDICPRFSIYQPFSARRNKVSEGRAEIQNDSLAERRSLKLIYNSTG
jgi:hypothetical protein